MEREGAEAAGMVRDDKGRLIAVADGIEECDATLDDEGRGRWCRRGQSWREEVSVGV